MTSRSGRSVAVLKKFVFKKISYGLLKIELSCLQLTGSPEGRKWD